MFRTLGLRHLVVVNHYNRVVGMITRQDLAYAEARIKAARMRLVGTAPLGEAALSSRDGRESAAITASIFAQQTAPAPAGDESSDSDQYMER